MTPDPRDYCQCKDPMIFERAEERRLTSYCESCKRRVSDEKVSMLKLRRHRGE